MQKNFEDLKVRAVSAPWHNGIDVLVTQEYIRGKAPVVRVSEIILTEINPGEALNPSFTMDKTSAQVLMDDLWNAGIRPTEGSGSAGSLRATERHLNDMRAIVSKSLGVTWDGQKKAP